MPEVKSYEPGVPCWVDLCAPDMDAAKAFYNGLFGWAATDEDEQFGGYSLFTDAAGHPTAGVMPRMDEQQPVVWTTYVNVADADATTKAVQDAGGQVLAEPMDVGDLGRMAVFLDTQGGAFGIWQPQTFHGAGVVNEPNTMCWNEFACRDAEAGKTFYGAVFGWAAETSTYGDMTYTEFKVGGRSIAGMIQMNDQWPADVPPHWMVYFAVGDCDASAAKAQALGGAVAVPASDIPTGRFAMLSDPNGAHFSIIKLAP